MYSDPALPLAAGVGLRAPHVSHVLAHRPRVAWLEVHSENYFADGGAALRALERIRADYPIALHGVGLSLGSADALDVDHLGKLRRLVRRIEPAMVSEHLCWSGVDGRHYNDLLPLPYTEEALAHVCARVAAVQAFLGRAIAVENVSSYYAFPESTIEEAAFVAAIARHTGCKLLLDVNNVYVNARNHGIDAHAYLRGIDPDSVAEIHLAGFEDRGDVVVDTHGAPVSEDVWALYGEALGRFGPRPTLVEWDTDIPSFDVLEREAGTAQSLLAACHAVAA
jgi:hypothetical protein